MTVIRPIALSDLDSLLQLSLIAGFGLTTLPNDPNFLRKRIITSQRSFEQLLDDPPGQQSFLFVMEDMESGRVIGTCGIIAKVGGFEPFYAYRLETSVHESQTLGIRKEIPVLHLVAEHNGPSEICSLFLAPDFRKDNNGRLLSLSRFLFMAEYSNCFDPMVLAEMRGVIDDNGRSAFWEAIGRHFFDLDFPKANYLSILNKRFIAELMPRHPIYAPLLPQEAQRVIGDVHEQTRPALQLLKSEGFKYDGVVDIFEAGPVVTSPLNQIRTARDSRKEKISQFTDTFPDPTPHLISSAAPHFRTCKAPVDTITSSPGVRISSAAAAALKVGIGDTIRFAPLYPPGTHPSNPKSEPPRS